MSLAAAGWLLGLCWTPASQSLLSPACVFAPLQQMNPKSPLLASLQLRRKLDMLTVF